MYSKSISINFQVSRQPFSLVLLKYQTQGAFWNQLWYCPWIPVEIIRFHSFLASDFIMLHIWFETIGEGVRAEGIQRQTALSKRS